MGLWLRRIIYIILFLGRLRFLVIRRGRLLWIRLIYFWVLFRGRFLLRVDGVLRRWRWSLSLLRVLICFLVIISQIRGRQHNIKGLLIIWGILRALLLCFIADNLLRFYIFYEIRAVVVFRIILILGYQPERLMAAMLVLLFTAVSSLPLLLVILFLKNFFFTDLVFVEQISRSRVGMGNWLYLFFFLGFLVKFPIYIFHFWLPKAHVEASGGGSMLLAGILLKLGRYGLFLFGGYIRVDNYVQAYVFFFALGGGLLSRLICLRQKDMKVLIAYSSVTHMSLVISRILSGREIGVYGALLIRVAHGLISSGLFFQSGLLYSLRNSRLFMFNRGGLNLAPSLRILWFIFRVRNIGAPPTLNFWREIIIFFRVFRYSLITAVLVGLTIFFSVCYRIILYIYSQNVKEEIPLISTLAIREKSYIIRLGHLLFFLMFRFLFIRLY